MVLDQQLQWEDLQPISDKDIRTAALNLLKEGHEVEAERVLNLWKEHQILKQEYHRLYREYNTQVPITVEHSKH